MLLKHAVRHYRDKVMFDCRPAYLTMILSGQTEIAVHMLN